MPVMLYSSVQHCFVEGRELKKTVCVPAEFVSRDALRPVTLGEAGTLVNPSGFDGLGSEHLVNEIAHSHLRYSR